MDPIKYLTGLIEDGLRQLEMGYVDPKALSAHLVAEAYGAAMAFDAAGLLSIDRAKPMLDRLGDELVDRGLAERWSASMSSSTRMVATAFPSSAPRPAPVPREPIDVLALMVDGTAEPAKRFVLTSLERWTDGFVLRYWASPPVTADAPPGPPQQLDWQAADDRGVRYEVTERRHSSHGPGEVGAVRFTPAVDVAARSLAVEAQRPGNGTVALRARIPLPG